MIIPDNMIGYNILAFFTNKKEGIDIKTLRINCSYKKIFIPKQKHTNNIFILTKKSLELDNIIADGVLTNEIGILIGVNVADCVPILLMDRHFSGIVKVVGAVHAGWRGTSQAILKNAIFTMIKVFNSQLKNIFIAIGPSIRGCCYDVTKDVFEMVKAETGKGNYYIIKDGKIFLDLALANVIQALSIGVPEKNIWLSKECTFCNPQYISYRRTKSNKRQGGFIVLNGNNNKNKKCYRDYKFR